jgi:hypothetical protein
MCVVDAGAVKTAMFILQASAKSIVEGFVVDLQKSRIAQS